MVADVMTTEEILSSLPDLEKEDEGKPDSKGEIHSPSRSDTSMTKLPVVYSREAIKALSAAGFEDAPRRGKGSHSALIKRGKDKTRLVIVPDRNTRPRGTLRAILDQAALSKDEFIDLLER
jgi:predicted RNA binding protein YcfA (HicA-like mRNA interferase family)